MRLGPPMAMYLNFYFYYLLFSPILFAEVCEKQIILEITIYHVESFYLYADFQLKKI